MTTATSQLDSEDRRGARAGSPPAPRATPVAVTGVACRLPGGVDSADALWKLLRDAGNAVGEAPAGRWDADELSALEREASRPPRWVGGFLDGGGGGPYLLTGNVFATAAGRVSHALGLTGPSMALDTACSSGLVAAHQACQSLQLGECDMALAGSVNLLLSPRVIAAFNETGVLSPTGQCQSFDREADGYVRAEGAVAIAALHCAGQPVAWDDDGAGELADLPPTAWSRQHHLIDLAPVGPSAVVDGPAQAEAEAVAEALQHETGRGPDIRAALRAAASPTARQVLVEDHVVAELRSLLRLRARRIDPTARFSDLGLDSLHAVRLRNNLQSSLGIAIALDAVWSNASGRALGTFLAEAAETAEAAEAVEHDETVVAAAPPTPTPARPRFVDLPAGRFHYLHWGHTALPQAVLLHANCASAASWTRVAGALAGEYEVFALDLRGHGASTAADSYGLRAAADDVVACLAALEIVSPLLVGHSWGAAVALVVAGGAESGTAPPALSGLVLEDPPPSLSSDRLDSLLATLALSAEDMRETLLVSHPDWDATDRATMVQGWRQASGSVATSLLAAGPGRGRSCRC